MTLPNTEVPQKNLFQFILHYGALLGLFWMFKYLFRIGQEYWEHFVYFYTVLQIGTPLLMYFFYTKYLQAKGIPSTIGKSLIFCIGIGFCASLFEDVMVYAHYAFVNSSDMYDAISKAANIMTLDKLQEMYPSLNVTELTNIREQILNMLTLKFVLIMMLFLNTLAQTVLSAIFGLVIGIFPPRNFLSNQKK